MKYTRQSIGLEAALALCAKEWWKGKTHRELAEFQLLTSEICMPFSVFHEALEKAIGRPICPDELVLDWDGICEELFDGKPAPSFQEIRNLMPEEIRSVIIL